MFLHDVMHYTAFATTACLLMNIGVPNKVDTNIYVDLDVNTYGYCTVKTVLLLTINYNVSESSDLRSK